MGRRSPDPRRRLFAGFLFYAEDFCWILTGHFHQMGQGDFSGVHAFIVGYGEHCIQSGDSVGCVEDIVEQGLVGSRHVPGGVRGDDVDPSIADGPPRGVHILLLSQWRRHLDQGALSASSSSSSSMPFFIHGKALECLVGRAFSSILDKTASNFS